MTIKWNWGTKIALVYGGFVVFMVAMVYRSTLQHYDLVTPDYYAKELKYQDVIDGEKNLQESGKSVTINQLNNAIVVQLPSFENGASGQVQFYKPDNASLDLTVNVDATGVASVPVSKLSGGFYKVKSNWIQNGKHFYNEQDLRVKN